MVNPLDEYKIIIGLMQDDDKFSKLLQDIVDLFDKNYKSKEKYFD